MFEPGKDVEHIEDLLVPYLNHANSVRVLAFELTDPGILAALQRFQPSQADIRGVLDGFAYSPTLAKTVAKQPQLFWFLKDRRFVRAPSHPFTLGKEQDFMHNKTLILDGTTVITGSYNLSEHAETNAENMLVIESAEIARFYLSYFDALFAKYGH
jgi:phosphatidylserine/phosphatidylglycerophosphate/cardiolipin synthase-like enzyme